jgi:YCII-related domain
MGKYLLIYRDSADPQPPPSPEEMQGFLKMWDGWFDQFGKKIADKGDGLLPTGRVLKPDGVVADGPYVEAKEMIGGFSVVEANSYEEAVEVAKLCPIAQIGGAIEIREFAGFV